MSEQTPIELRQREGSSNVDIKFQGKWTAIGTLGTTSFGVGLDTSPENQDRVYAAQDAYAELADRTMRLFLASPDLLVALRTIGGTVTDTDTDGARLRLCVEVARAAIQKAG